jgi:hypothetical protein
LHGNNPQDELNQRGIREWSYYSDPMGIKSLPFYPSLQTVCSVLARFRQGLIFPSARNTKFCNKCTISWSDSREANICIPQISKSTIKLIKERICTTKEKKLKFVDLNKLSSCDE